MLCLGIETSGKTASAAVCDGEHIIGESILYTKLTHSQVILPMVKKLLEDCSLTLRDIDRIAVANGPGSYTGLRIGIAAVKGMCMGLDCECCGVSTLMALSYNVCAAKDTVLAVLKARTDVYYLGGYKADGDGVKCVFQDHVCSAQELKEYAQSIDGDVIIVGDCCDEVKELLHGMENVRCAPSKDRLQRASSLCFAAMNCEPTPPEALGAAYLQDTKAEKDKAHSP